jgi:hypothetical protein
MSTRKNTGWEGVKTLVRRARREHAFRHSGLTGRAVSRRKLTLFDFYNLETLRALCRYETHGGYVWAGVMSDGELLCVSCLRAEYRQVFRATRDNDESDFALVGYANSGESEETEYCAHCNAPVWEHDL